jgi:hypothetical protein
MEIYTSIDTLPVYLFDQINKTGKLDLLIKGKPAKKLPDLEKIWEKIYDEFIAEFGMSELFLSYLAQMCAAIQHYKKAFIDGDRVQLNFARIKMRDAEQIFSQNSKAPNNIYAIVSKFMGFRVDPMVTPTREFYQYLKLATQSIPKHGKED